jgi:hypothetical protein
MFDAILAPNLADLTLEPHRAPRPDQEAEGDTGCERDEDDDNERRLQAREIEERELHLLAVLQRQQQQGDEDGGTDDPAGDVHRAIMPLSGK